MENNKQAIFSLEAEQAVLGSCLVDKEAVFLSMEELQANDFHRQDNKTIFEAMGNLFNTNQPIDIITVKEELESMKKFESVGGMEYLVYLTDSVPIISNTENYIKIVKERAIKRNLINIGNEITNYGYDISVTTDELLTLAEKKIFDVANGTIKKTYRHIRDVMIDSLKNLEDLNNKKNKMAGISTGFYDLDKKISGLKKSNLIILAARPGMGKSALAVNIAVNVAKYENKGVLIFNLEMKDVEINNRIISSEAMITNDKINNGNLNEEEWKNLATTMGVMSDYPIYIDDTSGLTILVDNDNYRYRREGEINAYFCDYITWFMEIEKISKENKKDYIQNTLKENNIELDKNNCFDDLLSNEPFWKIRDELTNIILECKIKNITKINDEIVKNDLKREQYKGLSKNDKINGLQELEGMIGMKDVKEQIEKIVNFVRVNKKRENMPMLHMCFLGNPGTGKTTVARVVGQIFAEEQILSKERKFVEVHGRDLIAKFVGWTAQTTKQKVEEAENGVLFIDEAYSLNPREHRGFEDEAIATLIKEMEDKRDRLCVIMAGYTNEMEDLLKTNPGFDSRIQFKVEFPDYTEEELYEIFKTMAKKEEYKISSNIKQTLIEYFKVEKKNENFGNARTVRNLFEKVKFEQANRVSKNKEENINVIKKSDIEKVVSKIERPKIEKIKIGF